MTIAQAFNEITLAQGGTPSKGGTITGAIDALNDTLAGSDQKPSQTIEGAIRLLGAHIGGGGGSSDLSEATVTITAAGDINYFAFNSCQDGEFAGLYNFVELSSGENTVKIVLYKNKYTVQILPLQYTVSDLSGDIALIDAMGGFYEITGDCAFAVAEVGGGGGIQPA